MPAYDPNEWEVVSGPDLPSGYDPREWEVVYDYEPYPEPTPQYSGPINTYRESGAALRLRQQAQREAEMQPDESTILERLALGGAQGLRSLESGLGGLFNLISLTPVGRALQSNARAGSAELADVSQTLGGQNPDIGREFAEYFGGMAAQQAPSIVAGRYAGPVGAAIVGGLQSAGSTQDAAEQAYEAQGFSPDMATAKARLPALASGAITGLLTRFMPGHLGEGVTRNMPPGSIYSIVRNVSGEIFKEAGEEALDQLGQIAVAKASYDPDKPLNEIIAETWEAAGWGGGMAAGIGALTAGARAAVDRGENQFQTGADLQTPPPASPTMDGEFEVVSEPPPLPIQERVAPENPFYPYQDTSGMNLRGLGLTSMLPTDELEFQTVEGEQPGETIQQPIAVSRVEQIRQQAAQTLAAELNAAGLAPEMASQVGNAIATIQRGNLTLPDFDIIDAALGELDRFGFRLPNVGDNQKTRTQARRTYAEENRAALSKLQEAARASIPVIQQPVPIASTPINQPSATEDESFDIRFPRDPNQFSSPEIRRNLEANMQGRSMDISMADFGIPDAHIKSVLGPEAPSWQELAEAGVINASPNEDGTVNVRVSPTVSETATVQPSASAVQNQFVEPTEMVAPTGKPDLQVQPKPSAPKYERAPDIVDDIEGYVGKLRRIKPGEKSEHADLWRAAQKAMPKLFVDSPTASAPDVAAQGVEQNTGRPIDPETLLNQIIEAPKKRKSDREAFYSEVKQATQDAKFQTVAAKERKNTKPIVSDELSVGDKFKIQGERFTVTNVKTRPDDETMLQSVTIDDGPKFGTQTLTSEQVLNIDKGTMRRANGNSQQFGAAAPSPRGSTPQTAPLKAEGSQGTLVTEPVNTPPPQGPSVAIGRATDANIPTLVNASALSPQTKKVLLRAHEIFQASGLNSGPLTLELRRYIGGGFQGQVMLKGGMLGSLVRLAEGAKPDAAAHEIFHILIQSLPEADRAALEAERLAKMPANAPQEIRDGKLSSVEFQFRVREPGWSMDLYPFINLDEYAAKIFGDRLAQETLEQRSPGIINRIKQWFAQLWKGLKGLLKDPTASERVYRDILEGRQKYDAQPAFERAIERGTFVTDANEAINAANLASSAMEQQIEGESQLAQAADVTNILDQFGVNTADPKVQNAFDYRNWKGIRDIGEQLNPQGRETYQQMKARLANDPYRRARLAGEGGQSILRFEEILQQVLDDSSKAFKKLTSRHFQDFIARVQAKAAQNQAAQAILTNSKAVFDSAIKEATAALKQEAKTDRDMAVLQGELRGIREASESTVAMEQTLNDMVTALSSTPEGQNALFTGQGGGRSILEIYKDIKRSTGQPLNNQNLLKWASYILAKSPKLAARIQAANLAKQTGLRAQLNGMAKKLADDFSKDPVATVRRAMRDRERKVRNAMSAEFAFKELEEEMLSELEPLLAAVDAGGIAARIKADPQFQALRKEILNDQTSWGGSPEPGKALRSADDAGSTITLPVVPGVNGAPPLPMSGATIGIGHEVLDGNVVHLRQRWDEQRKAIGFLENWLANPQNADDPTRRYHAHNLELLKNYYGGLQHIMPENQSPLWGQAYSIIGSAISKSGSRLVGQARSVLNRADQMHKWSRDWFERAVHTLPMTQRAAMKSHGLTWNNLRGRSIVEANRIYQQRVGQELAASWQRQQGGYNVGDTLSSGEVVTREDMAHLEAQSKAGFDALNLAAKFDEQITKDARGLKKTSNYRSALRTSPYLVPRMFDYSLAAQAKAVSDAVKAGDPAAIEAALNQLWPQVGASLLIDRNPEFAKRTIFDGKGGAFEVAANMMKANPNVIPTIDALANELASSSTIPPDQAKEIVLEEFGRIVSNWSNAVQEKVAAAEQGGKSGDAKNSFTQARGDALAPWTFYRTGFTTTDDVSNHAAGMQSVAVDRVVATLQAIDKDLERQESDLSAKAKELERLGKPNAKQSAIALKEVERRRGQTFDNWQNLKDRRARIQGVLNDLQNPSVSNSDFNTLFNRGAGALVGSLIGNIVTTMKNVSSIFLGRQLRAAGMDEFNTTLRSMLFTKAEAAKILASFAFVGVPKSFGYLLRGMARGVPQLLKGNAREAYLSALRDVIRELSVNVPRRLQSVRELEAAGMYQLPDKVAQFDNQILGSILYRGGIPANEFEGAAKVGGYAAGLFEATLLALANAGFPTMGDAAINGAMWNAVNSQWGPVQGMQDSLKKLYTNWMRGGLPRTFNLQDPADPVNRLSPKELGLSEQTLSQVRRTYQMAGMSFDERAAAFMAELQSNPQSAQFLTTENRQALTETLINKMNRASFSNSPLKFKDGSFLSNMVRPLYGWSLRSFADWEESMAVPTNTETGKMKLWARSMALAGLALAMTGAGGQLQDELVARMLRRALYNQESQNRLPWEEQSLGRGAAGVARLGLESVPLLGILGNLLIPANTPARASFEPTLAVWEAGKSIASWIHGMVASGDPMFGLPDMAAKFIPDSKIVINRLDSQEGRRAGANAVADIKRFATPDLIRPAYKGAVARGIDESTPWKQKMDNAAFRGDRAGFQRAAREAVQANLRMGNKDPVRAVQNYWRSRNPETRALTRRMTPIERAEMMRRAAAQPGANLATEIQQAQQNWAQAGAMIGVRQRDQNTNRVSLRAPSLSRVGRGMARY